MNRQVGETPPKKVIADEFQRFLREEGAQDRWNDFADGVILRLAEAGWVIARVTDLPAPRRARRGPDPDVAKVPPQCRWVFDCHAAPTRKVKHSKLGEIDACDKHAAEHDEWIQAAERRALRGLVNILRVGEDDEPAPWCYCPDKPKKRVPYCPLHGTPAERGIDTSVLWRQATSPEGGIDSHA